MKKFNQILVTALLFFSSSFLIGMEENIKYVTVVTSDGHEIQLEPTIIENCQTISKLLSDSMADGDIILPEVTADVLIKITPLLDLINATQDVQANSKIITKRLLKDIHNFETYVEIFNAANYLNCQPLLHACAEILADLAVKGLKSRAIETIVQWIGSLAIPPELSCMLGQKIIERCGFSPLARLPQEIAEAVEGVDLTVFVYSPDQTLFAYAIANDGIYIWNCVTKQKLQHIERAETVYALGFSPDNSLLAEAAASPGIRTWDTLRIWNMKDVKIKIINQFSILNYQHVATIAISYDNKNMITSYPNSTFSQWSIEDEGEAFEMQLLDNESNNPMVYDEQGKLTRLLICNTYYTLVNAWYLKYPQLKQELNKLNAAQALLFIWIVKQISSDLPIVLSKHPGVESYYDELVQNPTIYSCIKDYVVSKTIFDCIKKCVTLKENSCIIS